jgi:hypothetical protein
MLRFDFDHAKATVWHVRWEFGLGKTFLETEEKPDFVNFSF